MERWKDVPGYENFYQVSDSGRVRSLKRTKACGHGHRSVQVVPEKILKPSPRKGGYLMVPLRKYGVQRYFFVHTLVLTSFVSLRPIGMQCCHEDDDPTNNQLDNLRWDTPKNNCRDRGNYGVAKLTKVQVREIRKIYKSGGVAMSTIGKMFGVTQGAVSRIINGQVWSHVSD